jgi:hypothetical protein
MNVEEYRNSYLLNLQCLLKRGQFRPDAMVERVKDIIELIRPYAFRDDAKWLPRASPKNLTFDQQVQYLIDWIPQRVNMLLNLISQNLPKNATDVVKNSKGKPAFNCGVINSPTSLTQLFPRDFATTEEE